MSERQKMDEDALLECLKVDQNIAIAPQFCDGEAIDMVKNPF